MPRFELGLATPLRFESKLRDWAPPAIELGKSETVAIEFEGHEFIWHDPDTDHDPTIVVTHKDDREALASVRYATQRLLSALAFETESSIGTGGSTSNGEADAWWQPSVNPPRSAYFTWLRTAPSRVDVSNDPRVRLALAVNREALSAGSPLYRFLAFWNAIEVAIPDDGERRQFLDARVPYEQGWSERTDVRGVTPSTYLWNQSRKPVAHGAMGPRRVIDPDDAVERSRLELDGTVLEPLVKMAILRLDANPVRATYRS